VDDVALPPDLLAHYGTGYERERLSAGVGSLEAERTRELLRRFLPPAPARILDAGGGPGAYAAWLAAIGYRVHLLDPVPLHVEQARSASAAQPEHPFSAEVGDARHLAVPDASCDAVLLLGPLYHLVDRADRLRALAEARRVLRPGGLLFAAAISRFASLLDGLRTGALADPEFAAMVERDLREGQHRNPRPDEKPEWFATAYFHRPDELAEEIATSRLHLEGLFGVEGPGWLFETRWEDPALRERILDAARATEQEPTLSGLSAHLLAVATR
jgi:SAM-dependent methyltransferase